MSSFVSVLPSLSIVSEESVGVVDGSEGKGLWWAFIRAWIRRRRRGGRSS